MTDERLINDRFDDVRTHRRTTLVVKSLSRLKSEEASVDRPKNLKSEFKDDRQTAIISLS